MADQCYQHHVHHPRLAYATSAFALIALILVIGQGFFDWDTANGTMAALTAAVFCLAAISRLYVVALQDRIIMLEVKIRAAELLSAGQDSLLAKLSKKQIVALRFAADEELGSLLERAVRENLSPRDIKASIRTWRPDYFRT